MQAIDKVSIVMPKSSEEARRGSVFERGIRTSEPNLWFSQKFPEAGKRYGSAFLEGNVSMEIGYTRNIPLLLNDDLFAAILGGDKQRLRVQVVYYSEDDTFYFYDYLVDAFCPVSEDKLKILLSNYLIRCAEECTSVTEIKNIVMLFRGDNILDKIIVKAKAILEADRSFFEGEHARKRMIDGKIIDPAELPSFIRFGRECVHRDDKATLTLNDAYQAYFKFSNRNGIVPLIKNKFRAHIDEFIRSKYGLGIRNDVPATDGKHQQGWKWIGLREVCIPEVKEGLISESSEPSETV